MNKYTQWIFGIFVALLCFLSRPRGPLGGFWPPSPMPHTPTSMQLPFFILINIFEAVGFATAVVLLVFHFPKKPFAKLTLTETRLSFIALLWFLGNWWMHDSLHAHIGMSSFQNLLYVEYGFHVTMMLAAVYLLCVIKKLGFFDSFR